MARKVKGKATQDDLQHLADLLVEHFRWEGKPPTLSLDDEYDYTSSGSPVILWEEGPEEWVYFLPDTALTFARERGLFLEPVTHIVIGVYPA